MARNLATLPSRGSKFSWFASSTTGTVYKVARIPAKIGYCQAPDCLILNRKGAYKAQIYVSSSNYWEFNTYCHQLSHSTGKYTIIAIHFRGTEDSGWLCADLRACNSPSRQLRLQSPSSTLRSGPIRFVSVETVDSFSIQNAFALSNYYAGVDQRWAWCTFIKELWN